MNYLNKCLSYLLKIGYLPKHIAFIMDGNRRYALKYNINKLEGHTLGFEKLKELLEWCLELNIKNVTVYAFSIENFKRPKEEVQYLMKLAIEKFTLFLNEGELIAKHGVCVRFIGNLKLLPKDVLGAVSKLMQFSRHNTKAYLNICFPYTSQDEMNQTIITTIDGVKTGYLFPLDINEDLYSNSLYTGRYDHPDLLVRTSGETRLSDFLLYQTGFAHLEFIDVLWPELSLWNLTWCILNYQRDLSSLKEDKKRWNKNKLSKQSFQDRECIHKYLEYCSLSSSDNNRKCFCEWMLTYLPNSVTELKYFDLPDRPFHSLLLNNCVHADNHTKLFGSTELFSNYNLMDGFQYTRDLRSSNYYNYCDITFNDWIDSNCQ